MMLDNLYSPPEPPTPLERDINVLINTFKNLANAFYKQYYDSPYTGMWIHGNDNSNQHMMLFKNYAYEFAKHHKIKKNYIDQWIDDIYSASRSDNLEDVLIVIESLKSNSRLG